MIDPKSNTLDRKKLEKVYDEQISPLMKQIIEICWANDIPVFAEFQFGECDFVKTNVSTNGHFKFKWLDAVSQCAEADGMNADKFIMWLMKHPNKSSAMLHLLGKKVEL